MNSIRKIISEECDYPICAESIEELKAILENVAHKIVIGAMAEFDELNEYRRKHGLRELKRLNSYAIKKGAEKVLNGVFSLACNNDPDLPASKLSQRIENFILRQRLSLPGFPSK